MPDSSDVSLNKNLRKKIMPVDLRTFAITLVRKSYVLYNIFVLNNSIEKNLRRGNIYFLAAEPHSQHT